ncbi:unnamed protein product [Rhizoctonia solani]|uniref:Uncharacterized protein n=1 Tax=Rhizoctonia solani TaxID=456999 RepID=A0A8H3GIM8_9AGAM|nr:unnamed protein product [Rhizoctonia solani]
MSSEDSLPESILTISDSTDPRENRLKDIFPPGFDGKHNITRGHYTLAPGQLYRSLTNSNEPDHHVESIIVKTAWYAKGTKHYKQEFILMQVQDREMPDLENYLILDRSDSTPSSSFSGIIPDFRMRAHGLVARDAFRIAYDGGKDQLLHECHLSSHKQLEQLDFQSGKPLYLYQLATLVFLTSERYPDLPAAGMNHCWFTRLIWECLGKERPIAKRTPPNSPERKWEKIDRAHNTPSSEQITNACREFQQRVNTVDAVLAQRKKMWEGQQWADNY